MTALSAYKILWDQAIKDQKNNGKIEIQLLKSFSYPRDKRILKISQIRSQGLLLKRP
jgi:hypothetical protein